MALCAASIAAATLVQAKITERQLRRDMKAHAREAAGDLENPLRPILATGGEAALLAAVKTAMSDGRLAFVSLTDADGEAVSRVRDQAIWRAYRTLARNGEGDQAAPLGKAVEIRSPGGAVGMAIRTVIWESEGGSRAPAQPLGYLAIGATDPSFLLVQSRARRIALGTIGLTALVVIPITAFSVGRLTRPIQRVAEAAESLASGRRPEPLPERGAREVATLGRSFNRMVDELHAAHEALRATNRSLEEQVEERTRDLARVNELLEFEIREKDDLLRTVSHDLGAPLRNIAGMASMLRDKHAEDLPESALRKLDRIGANVRMEQAMLDDLLELSRLARMPERPERVDVEAMVRDLGEAFDYDLRRGGIELVVRGPLPDVHLSAARLRNVLQNLLDNAIKYMGESEERRITVSCALTPAHAIFEVADTGPGIDESDHDRIFEVFRRGSSAASGGAEGRGVGLAAVRSVVERWSGKLTLDSAPGRGSRFRFTVPADRVICAGGEGSASEAA